MNPWIAALAAMIGYSLGAVSFTRIVGRFCAPGSDMGDAEIPISGSDKTFHLRSYGATSVRAKAGARYGCLTSILDMIKVTLPALALRLLYPESLYFLILAACGVAGHNFPVFYKFKGGRGFSPLYGGLLVIDWLAIPVITLFGLMAGFWMTRYAFVAYFGVTLTLIPWFWLRFDDSAYLLYALTVNALFWIASLPELKMYLAYTRAGNLTGPADSKVSTIRLPWGQ
jgi:glycerol-3-phosphate acyltransferase PlsY